MLTRTFSGQTRGNPLVAFGFLVFVVVAAYEVSEFIVSGTAVNLVYGAMIFVGGAVAVAILNDFRKGVYFFIIWLLFEDLARKYLGNNMAIYFAKDALALIVYISYFMAVRKKQVDTFRPPFLVPLMVLVWFGFLQVFNPASTSLAYGAMGMKLYFFYVPLIMVGYSLFETEEQLRKFFFVNVGVAAVIAGLGIAQAIIGPTFLNPAIPAEDIRELSTLYRVSPVTNTVIYRPVSVFVSDGRFGFYMILAWILCFGLGAYLLLRSRKGRIFASACLGVVTVAIALSGSRGALLWTAGSGLICAAAFIWGAPWKQGGGGALRIIRTIQRTLLFGGAALILLFMFNPTALMSRWAFYSETLAWNTPQSELVYRLRDYPLQNFIGAFNYPRWPYGYGIGTASLGVQYVTRFFHAAPPTLGTENGYGQILIELGIVGLILWIVMSVVVSRSCWLVVRKLKGSPWFPLAFVIGWYAFLLLIPLTYNGMVAYQNFVENAFLWLLIGILFRIPKIALSSQFSADAQPPKRSRWKR